MKKVMECVKNNKAIILLTLVIIVLIIVGLTMYFNNKKKEYYVEEVSSVKYYELKQGDKYGIIDITGNTILEAKYEEIKIPNPENPVFICKTEGKNVVLNDKNEQLFTNYEEVDAIQINGIVSSMPYEKTVLKYKQNGKFGLIDYNGKQITKPIYEEIEGLNNKESELLVKENGKYGVINAKGAKLINTQYDDIEADGFYTSDNKYALSGYIVCNKTEQGYRYGYISNEFKEKLNVEYNSIERILETKEMEDTYLIVSKNGRYGVIKNDKNIINYEYQDIEYDPENEIFRIQRNDKFGVADKNGNQIIDAQYSEIQVNGIYLHAIKDGQDIYFDTLGNEIQNNEYTSILKTQNENYYISINAQGLYGILNKDKQKIVENKYAYIEYLFEEYFIVANEEGNLGVINKSDETVVDFIYEVLQKVDNTNVIEAKILKENKTELYSKSLQKVCSMNNAVIYKYENYIRAYSDDEIMYFDFEGNEMQNTQVFPNNILFAVKKENKWGFENKDKNIVVECTYDEVTEFNEYGFAGIKVENKWGIIDETGKIIIDPIYEIEQTNAKPEFLGKYYKVYYGYGQSYYTDIVSE